MRDTTEMAREVKATAYTSRHYPDRTTYTFNPEQLESFVALVRADERAACCDAIWKCDGMGLEDRFIAMDVIKARGNT